MTDDEIRQMLKPRHNWLAVGGFALAFLGTAAGLAKWAFTAPTRDDYSSLENRTKTVELDHAVLKANVDGMRNDLADVKSAARDINAQLTQLSITRRR